MIPRLDPASVARTYRDPVSVAGLILDLAPIFAVIAFGWGAATLVLLYWLENVMIGAATLLRMVLQGASKGIAGLVGAGFIGMFFTVHYGLFCFVHGVFVRLFANGIDAPFAEDEGFPTPFSLIGDALNEAPGLSVIAAGLFAWHLVSAFQTWQSGADEGRGIETIMGEPYGRIIILHVGRFAGMAALAALGDPMIGVLALILLDVAWGVFLALRRDQGTLALQPES